MKYPVRCPLNVVTLCLDLECVNAIHIVTSRKHIYLVSFHMYLCLDIRDFMHFNYYLVPNCVVGIDILLLPVFEWALRNWSWGLRPDNLLD